MCLGLPVNAVSLLIGFSLFRSLNDRPQVRPLMSVTPGNGGTQADVTAQPPMRRLHFGQRHRYAHTSIPFPVLAKNLRRFIQLCPRKRQGAVNGNVSLSRNIKPTILAPCSGSTPEHDPAVKAFCFPWLLYLRTVNQFSLQEAGNMACLSGSLVVNECSSVSSANEVTQTPGRGKARLLHARKLSCDIRVRARKQSSQRRKGVCLIHRRIELELVGQDHGCHSESIAKMQQKTRTRPKSVDESKITQLAKG
jgi:hypothetical protein